MTLSTEDYRRLEFQFRSVIEALHSGLGAKSLSGVEHYLSHSEIEIAFEIFCLNLFEQGVEVGHELASVIVDVGRSLGLEQESIYDPNFWARLCAWSERQSESS